MFFTHVIQTAQKLRGTGFKIDDEWIGSLHLAGLPTPKYTPMIMAIEHSGVKISSDLIKTRLIDAESASEFEDGAAFASKRVDDRRSKMPKCFQCGEFGHKQAQCTVERIFRYLKGTATAKLKFGNNGSNLIGFTDADWAGEIDERRSLFMRNGGAISWNSRRQQTIALSSTEAEYTSLSAATQECLWLNQFQQEFWPQTKSTEIHCDNRSAICLT